MTLNFDAAKLYDTAFFFTDYFCKNYTEKKILSVYEDTEFMIKCLQFVRERAEKISEFLAPFAEVKSENLSALMQFLKMEEEKQDCKLDIDGVKRLIKTERDEFLDIFVRSIFGDEINAGEIKNDAPKYIKTMETLDATDDFKLKISYILNDFDYALAVLAEEFKKIYSTVNELHRRYEKEIAYAFEQIKSGLNLELYMQEFSYSPEKYEYTSVSIPLLNQFEVYCRLKDNKAFMLLGFRHTECFWNLGQTKPVDAKRFVVTAGNDMRMDIIDLIAKNGKITISSLAKIMSIPITTVGRHVSGLRNDNIIYISKRDGLQLFYSINTAYFKRLKLSFDEYVDKTVSLAEKTNR